jgi:regulation of enolase protein 1 (concanavalin A-like superfamily)
MDGPAWTPAGVGSGMRHLVRVPREGEVTVEHGALVVRAERGFDFWQKTYYEPLMAKDDGVVLGTPLPAGECYMETAFTLAPRAQFDQAGLSVRLSADAWLKCGIEYVDGTPRASVVVTNGGWSDWSTQPWPALSMGVRVSRVGGASFVVEFRREDGGRGEGAKGEGGWAFARVCSLVALTGAAAAAAAAAAGAPEVCGGMYWCSPTTTGAPPLAEVSFHRFSLSRGRAFHHDV